MADLLQRLRNTQERLRPYLERYCMLTLLDPSLPPGVSQYVISVLIIEHIETKFRFIEDDQSLFSLDRTL